MPTTEQQREAASAPTLQAEIERLRELNAALLAALCEVVIINEESAGDCRRRMGTRRGNSIVTARAAIKRATT